MSKTPLTEAAAARGASYTPYLRPGLDAAPSEYARTTCFTAGYLTSVNAGWRSEKPVIDQVQCTLCLNCYMYCPDGTVYKVRNDEGTLTAGAIDYDFCKGCGVCAKVCPADCLHMVDEHAGENEGAPVDTETTDGIPAIDGPGGEVG